MPASNLPVVVSGILPLIVTAISHTLRGAGLPQWLNILISLVALFLIALLCAWITDGFTADLRQTANIVLGFSILLSGTKEVIDLLSYLEINPSPLLAITAPPQKPIPTSTTQMPIVAPRPLILPPSLPPVPPTTRPDPSTSPSE